MSERVWLEKHGTRTEYEDTTFARTRIVVATATRAENYEAVSRADDGKRVFRFVDASPHLER